MTVDTVKVPLGARSYDVRIGEGLVANAAGVMGRLTKGARIAVITDKTVAGHHLGTLERSLRSERLSYEVLILPAGEATIVGAGGRRRPLSRRASVGSTSPTRSASPPASTRMPRCSVRSPASASALSRRAR